MDIGITDLTARGGFQKLVDAVRVLVFPTARIEAKEQYAQGHKVGGMLSRQRDESMISYISRRKRWFA